MSGDLDVHDLVRAAVAITVAATAAVQEGRVRHVPRTISLPPIALGFALAFVDGRVGATLGGLAFSLVAALGLAGTRTLAGGAAPLVIGLGTCLGFAPALWAWITAVLVTAVVRVMHARVYPGAADRGRPTLLASRIAVVAVPIGVLVDVLAPL